MKITEIKTWALHADVATPTYNSQPGLTTGRDSTVIEIVTDEGISGFGEALCQNRQPGQIAQTVIETALVDVVRGANPFDTAVLWEAMYTRTKDFGLKGAVIGAISAVVNDHWKSPVSIMEIPHPWDDRDRAVGRHTGPGLGLGGVLGAARFRRLSRHRFLYARG